MKKFLITILVIVAVSVLAAVIWLSTLEGKFDVKRSITVDQPVSEVFTVIRDFNQWITWSPWLCMEPGAAVSITGSGKEVNDSYSWSGDLVGSGTIKHIEIEPGRSIVQEITFKEPMESTSIVYWEFSALNDSTTSVTWGMKGEMPFFFRFMTKMMEPYVGMDYERGLKMIKDYTEKGNVASNVEILGVVDAPGYMFVGEKVSCSLDDVGEKMKESFNNLSKAVADKNINYDKALTVYHKFDFISGDCEYTTALPIKDSVSLGDGFYVGKVADAKALKIKFTGDYEHLGNAWAAGMSYMRAKKLSESKDVPPYEFYITDPEVEPDPGKWVTEIYMPIK